MVRETENIDTRLEISTNSIITKLNSLEPLVSILKLEYPKEYKEYKEKIDTLKTEYLNELSESEKSLTFEINPNNNYLKMSEVIALEKNIKNFIDIEMKYGSIKKRTQKFILKLNILYNTSIFYPNEKEKVLKQLEHGYLTEEKITKEFVEWAKCIGKENCKEQEAELLFYSEYIMYMIYIRNSKDIDLDNYNFVIEKYLKTDNLLERFKEYFQDEISILLDLVQNISDEIFRASYVKRINTLNMDILLRSPENTVKNIGIIKIEQRLEDEILNRLIEEKNIPEEKINIRVSDNINLNVTQNDVYMTPKIATILNLSSTFYGTLKNDALVLLSFVEALSDNITYKDIYFLVILFDLLDEIKLKCSALYSEIEKYDLKYNYTYEKMKKKKLQVLKQKGNMYYPVFKISNYEEKTFRTYLKKYNLDYKIEENIVYINTVYFNGLNNLKKELEENSKKFLNGGKCV